MVLLVQWAVIFMIALLSSIGVRQFIQRLVTTVDYTLIFTIPVLQVKGVWEVLGSEAAFFDGLLNEHLIIIAFALTLLRLLTCTLDERLKGNPAPWVRYQQQVRQFLSPLP